MTNTTTNFETAVERMERLDYERSEFEDKFHEWLDRGDDVIVFSNHDLGSIGSRMLGMALPIDRDAETPANGPDGEWGLGWRYLPDLRLTAPERNRKMDPENYQAEMIPQDGEL